MNSAQKRPNQRTRLKRKLQKEHDHPKGQVFFSGDEYFRQLKQDISKAQHEIWIECYIFAFDQLGQSLLLLLQEAVLRDVSVRLLVDGVGSADSLGSLTEFCRMCRIPFEVYHPLPLQDQVTHSLTLLRLDQWKRRLALIGFINQRNHRKIFLIDGHIAYLGSLNVNDHHLEAQGRKAWRDTGLRLEGSSLSWLRLEMEATWKRTVFFWRRLKRPRYLPDWLRLNSRLRWRKHMKRDLLYRIRKAKHRIYIATPYFVPRPRLLRFMKKAAKRGVDVQILVPERNDVAIVAFASRAFYQELMQCGIKIWEYQPSVMHAKTMLIDQVALIGSQNMNHRSYLHDLEIEVMVRDPILVQQVQAQWREDIKVSLLAERKRKSLRIWDRLVSWFFVRFKYWL